MFNNHVNYTRKNFFKDREIPNVYTLSYIHINNSRVKKNHNRC